MIGKSPHIMLCTQMCRILQLLGSGADAHASKIQENEMEAVFKLYFVILRKIQFFRHFKPKLAILFSL